MPSLESAEVYLTDPFDNIMASAKTETSLQKAQYVLDSGPVMSGSLKEFQMSGYMFKPCSINVTSLIALLRCMPSITKVSLFQIQMNGECDNNILPLGESLKEVKISSRFLISVDVTPLKSLLCCIPALTKVSLDNVQLIGELNKDVVKLCESLKEFSMSGAGVNFTGKLRGSHVIFNKSQKCMYVKKVGQRSSHTNVESNVGPSHNIPTPILKPASPGSFCSIDITLLITLLSCMPALTVVSLNSIQLINDGRLDFTNVVSFKSLTVFTMNDCSVSTMPLMGLLSYMSTQAKVTLSNIKLTDELDVNLPMLTESLKEFVMPSGNVTVVSLINFLSSMPALAKVTLSSVQLTGELDDNSVVLTESLEEFVMNSGSVNIVSFMSVLSSMPALAKVTLSHVQLTGKSDGNTVVLTESMKEFMMVSGSVNILSLMSLLSSMPALAKVTLSSVKLTGESDGSTVGLCESMKRFLMSGGSVNIVSLMSLLSYMPTLAKVTISSVQLTGESGGNTVVLTESMKKFLMSGGGVNIVSLMSLLSSIPALAKVTLSGVQLTGELDGSTVVLCESMKEFEMSGVSVNIVSLMSLLSSMPALAKVTLSQC